jgi:hypothetical protein
MIPKIEGKTVSLFSQPYLDTCLGSYKNIVVTNILPQGPLIKFIRRISFPPLSQFKDSTCKNCGYAITSLSQYNKLMTVDEVPDLISFLLSQGYTVDTSITTMFNNSSIQFDTQNGNILLCFITYIGK